MLRCPQLTDDNAGRGLARQDEGLFAILPPINSNVFMKLATFSLTKNARYRLSKRNNLQQRADNVMATSSWVSYVTFKGTPCSQSELSIHPDHAISTCCKRQLNIVLIITNYTACWSLMKICRVNLLTVIKVSLKPCKSITNWKAYGNPKGNAWW